MNSSSLSRAAFELPLRHGADVSKARRMARSLKFTIRGRDPEPTPEQWQVLGEALLRGDPLADDLAQWMCQQGMSQTRALFDSALESGLADLPGAPAALRNFIQTVERRPAWVNDHLLSLGARMCHVGGITACQVLRNAALMGGYQASAINRALVLTGALSHSPSRRVAETSRWWIDVTAQGGLDRQAPGFKGVLRVRLIHALMRRRVSELPQWDSAELGVPLNQADMLATYLGFSVVFLLGQRIMGVKFNDGEAHAVMHLWRYIGWLLGVEEDLLLEDEMAGRVRLYQVLLSQAPADASSRQLGRALMDEPLSHQYPCMPKLRGRYERAKNLSICRLFLGREGMHDLGLPGKVLPWFPLINAPRLALWHRLMRSVPGGLDWLVRKGRREQAAYFEMAFGSMSVEAVRPYSGQAR